MVRGMMVWVLALIYQLQAYWALGPCVISSEYTLGPRLYSFIQANSEQPGQSMFSDDSQLEKEIKINP